MQSNLSSNKFCILGYPKMDTEDSDQTAQIVQSSHIDSFISRVERKTVVTQTYFETLVLGQL